MILCNKKYKKNKNNPDTIFCNYQKSSAFDNIVCVGGWPQLSLCFPNASDLHPDTLQYQLPMIIIVHVQHQSVSNHFYSFGLFMIAK